ncbi:MAG TPA: type IV secretory system conjugative DNA transfer family protein [Candidatus Paceibacterota bacterium]
MPGNPEAITYFATTDSRNKREPFGIKTKDRSKHMYVIGKTGMGKSTLLENMAIQDIRNGEGIAFLDPHGATAEKLLDYIPQSRIKDVLYFAPFDMDYPIAFNVMEDVGADKRHLVVNGLMSTFEKIWVDAWSARMAYILQNTLLALLEFPNSTLLGVNRMLSDKDYRRAVVANISDPSVRSFWVDEFAKYTERFAAEATPAIQNKVGQFTSNPLIRNIIGQPKSTFNLRKMIDENKIIIVNLSKGRVGEGNANLLGSMFITRIYLAAMSRADASHAEMSRLPDFFLYVDEFQSFANKSFENILSEARKYKLNLTIAHQYVEQMEEEVQAAVFGNVGTTIAFRVGPLDAELLEKIFMPTFMVQDIVNLGFAQIYLSLMIDGVGSPPFSATTLPPIAPPEISFRNQILESSRQQFGRPRSVVEEDIKKWHEPVTLPPSAETRSNPPRESTARPGPSRTSTFRAGPPTAASSLPAREQSSPLPVRQEQKPVPTQAERQEQKPVPQKPASSPAQEESARLAHLRASLAAALQKRAPDKTKESTPEHKEGLRSALAGVLKQNTSSVSSPAAPPSPKPPIPNSQTAPPPPVKKEVSEEVLRTVLQGAPTSPQKTEVPTPPATAVAPIKTAENNNTGNPSSS